MKLATYQDGSRDGQLVVVSRDGALAHYATGICSTLQQLLDDWSFLSPQLQDLFDAINRGAGQGAARHAFPFEPARCMAPLPRIYQWALRTDKKLLQQSGGDDFVCAAQLVYAPHQQLAFLTADTPNNATQAQLRDGLRLAIPVQIDEATQAVQFAPVAMTLDEMGDGA